MNANAITMKLCPNNILSPRHILTQIWTPVDDVIRTIGISRLFNYLWRSDSMTLKLCRWLVHVKIWHFANFKDYHLLGWETPNLAMLHLYYWVPLCQVLSLQQVSFISNLWGGGCCTTRPTGLMPEEDRQRVKSQCT